MLLSSFYFFIFNFLSQHIFLFILNGLVFFHISDPLFVYGLNNSNHTRFSQNDAQLIFLNLERIDSQIDLTAQNLKDNNTEGAFYHSYIPHSVTYPTIKQLLEKIDPSGSNTLSGLIYNVHCNGRDI